MKYVTYWQRFDVRRTSWSRLDCLHVDGARDVEITRNTKVWLSCHVWKDCPRHLQEFWNLTALLQLTVLTERYGTLWFIRRTRSRMKRRPNWSIVPCKNCSSSYVGETGRKFGLRIKEHKKEVDCFTDGTPYTDPSLQGKGDQCNSQISYHRPCRGREPCHRLGQGKSGR